MKACPFCAEQIQDQARKCRFCGEWLDDEPGPEPEPLVPKVTGFRHCSACGSMNRSVDVRCVRCGADLSLVEVEGRTDPPETVEVAPKGRLTRPPGALTYAALAAGLISLFVLPIIFGPVALILAAAAASRQERGSFVALAVGLLATVVVALRIEACNATLEETRTKLEELQREGR